MSNKGDKQNAIWPLPKFKFSVDFMDGPTKISLQFSEISGLDAEAQVIEYRNGARPDNHGLKMPGIEKFNNVTLKRGVFVGNNDFSDWFKKVRANTIHRTTVIIKLLNQEEKPTMTWVLSNAWPTKVTSTDMKADGNEPAIETLELACEYVDISNQNNA